MTAQLVDTFNLLVLQNSSALVVIANDDATVLSVADIDQAEGNPQPMQTPFHFTVELSKPVDVPVVVTFSVANGTADNTDFQAPLNTTVVFPPLQQVAYFNVTVFADQVIEVNENFTVRASNVSAVDRNITVSKALATGLIFNDDAAFVQISDASAIEGNGGSGDKRQMVFQVTISRPLPTNATIKYFTMDTTDNSATAGQDYTPIKNGILSFVKGETSKTITIDIKGDIVVEDNERFMVVLHDLQFELDIASIFLSKNTGVGDIVNDDVLDIVVPPFAQNELNDGINIFTFPLRASSPVDVPYTITWVTLDGTALSTSTRSVLQDYISTTDNVYFSGSSNDLNKSIEVPVFGDRTCEKNETFSLIITSIVFQDSKSRMIRPNLLNSPRGPITIVNDERCELRILDAQQTEGNLGETNWVHMTARLSESLEADYNFSIKTVAFTAKAGSDFTTTKKNLTIGQGYQDTYFSIPVLGDELYERDEQFYVQPQGDGPIVKLIAGTVTILDDDCGKVGCLLLFCTRV